MENSHGKAIKAAILIPQLPVQTNPIEHAFDRNEKNVVSLSPLFPTYCSIQTIGLQTLRLGKSSGTLQNFTNFTFILKDFGSNNRHQHCQQTLKDFGFLYYDHQNQQR